MRSRIIRLLLAILNSRCLNQSPCSYEYVGNVDAFSRSNLEGEDTQRPGITVRTILDEATAFKACPIHKDGALMVIQDGTPRPATVWDLHELRQSIAFTENRDALKRRSP